MIRIPRPAQLAAVLLSLGMALPAAPALAAGLGAILQAARDNDPDFGAAREAQRAAVQRLEQAIAQRGPSLMLNANPKQVWEDSSGHTSQDDYDSGSVVLEGRLGVLQRAEDAAVKQARAQRDIASEQLRQAENDLQLRVARAYFDVLQAQDSLDAVRAQRAAFTEQLAQTQRAYQVGTASITDLNETESRLNLTLAQEIAARNELDVKQQALQRIVGPDFGVQQLAKLRDDARVQSLSSEELNALLARAALEGSPVVLARLNEEVAHRELERQRAGHWPTLDLVVQAGKFRNPGTPGAVTHRDVSQALVGLEFALPIYQSGLVQARTREARANVARAGYERKAAQQQVSFEAHQAMAGALSGSALVSALELALRSAETQLASTQRGLAVGTRARIDVYNAQQQLTTTRRDLSAARYQTLLAELQLKAAANQLSGGDFEIIESLFVEP